MVIYSVHCYFTGCFIFAVYDRNHARPIQRPVTLLRFRVLIPGGDTYFYRSKLLHSAPLLFVSRGIHFLLCIDFSTVPHPKQYSVQGGRRSQSGRTIFPKRRLNVISLLSFERTLVHSVGNHIIFALIRLRYIRYRLDRYRDGQYRYVAKFSAPRPCSSHTNTLWTA